jgi:hypothetical protein
MLKNKPLYIKAAWLIGGTLILILAASIITLFLFNQKNSGKTALIYQNGNLIQTIDLEDVSEPYQFTVQGDNEKSNTIEVRKNSIGIVKADCPDKLCVNMGFIHNSTVPITCLPNRLVIRITDIPSQTVLDDIVR